MASNAGGRLKTRKVRLRSPSGTSTLKKKSDVFPISQDAGLEFIYVLEGEIVYRHDDRLYPLRPGDSLFFDADAPHGPEKLRRLPIKFLSVISYARGAT